MFFKLISDRSLAEKRSTAEIRTEIEEARKKMEAGIE